MCYTVIPTENFEKDVKYYVKTKGFRNIIYYVVKDDREIYLLTIYSKRIKTVSLAIMKSLSW